MDFAVAKTTIKKYPVGSVATIIAVLMLAALVYRHSTMSGMKQDFEGESSLEQKLAANVTYSAQLEEQLHALVETNQVINGRLVNPQDLAINLQYFYKLEAETGVKLIDTRPANSPNNKATPIKGGFKPVQYAVSLQGNYARVLTFLRKLEQGNYYCRVITATCNQVQDEASEKKDSKEASDIVLSLTVEILGKA